MIDIVKDPMVDTKMTTPDQRLEKLEKRKKKERERERELKRIGLVVKEKVEGDLNQDEKGMCACMQDQVRACVGCFGNMIQTRYK